LTNKEKALSGSIRPLRGNEEALRDASAFELSVAGPVPSFLVAFEAKMAQFFPLRARLGQDCINLEQFP